MSIIHYLTADSLGPTPIREVDGCPTRGDEHAAVALLSLSSGTGAATTVDKRGLWQVQVQGDMGAGGSVQIQQQQPLNAANYDLVTTVSSTADRPRIYVFENEILRAVCTSGAASGVTVTLSYAGD